VTGGGGPGRREKRAGKGELLVDFGRGEGEGALGVESLKEMVCWGSMQGKSEPVDLPQRVKGEKTWKLWVEEEGKGEIYQVEARCIETEWRVDLYLEKITSYGILEHALSLRGPKTAESVWLQTAEDFRNGKRERNSRAVQSRENVGKGRGRFWICGEFRDPS